MQEVTGGMFPQDLYYTQEHEWIRKSGAEYVVGITAFATGQLGDITYVELPQVGTDVAQGDAVATVESVKAASDVYSPVAGRVCEVNAALDDRPELVNQDPYGEGWFFKLEAVPSADLSKLMSADAYAAHVQTLSE